MASLGTQLRTGAHTPCCQVGDHGASANGNPHAAQLQVRNCAAPRATCDAQLQTSRREVIAKMAMASGAAFLSWGAAGDASHAAAGEIETAEEAASNPLIQKLLEKSRANKTVNDAERLEDYYRRNFTEYFQFVEGSVRNKKELTPAEQAIVEWLAKNKK